ncbi:unnamed protein product [Blepharisma stoltei]|uniref:WD repeat-containing protein 6 n=1 Tax=Blepharisma stoltei TaxID=1481888 RepID=A0AAU9KMT5_9CILI|nr:unnamed protein product [Blepharisma stoltei]
MEEDWELLELSGPIENFAVHEVNNVIGYSIGTVIVLWDPNTNRKVSIRSQNGPVSSIIFSQGFDYLITISSSAKPMISVWRWRTLDLESSVWLPYKERKKSPVNVICNLIGNRLIAIENEAGGGYRVSIWEWKAPDLVLILVEELDMENQCIYTSILNDQVTLLTAEKNCLKLWKIEEKISIDKRMHLKYKLLQAEYIASLGIFIVLYDTGKAVSINTLGKAIANIEHQNLKLTCFSVISEQIYFGTNNGSIITYTLRSYRMIQEFSPLKLCPIKSIFSSWYLYISYSDANFQVISLSQRSIICETYGHNTKIISLSWYDRWNVITAAKSLNIWRHSGKGWTPQTLEINDEISALGVHPLKKAFCLGTFNGVLRLYDFKAQHRLIQSFQIGALPVYDIAYTDDGNFIGIGFTSGQAVLMDQYCQQILVRLEDTWSRNGPCLQTVQHLTNASQVKFLTLHEEGCLQLHHMEIRYNQLNKTQFNLFYIEGKCTGYSLHVSGNYAIAVSDIGAIYIFNVQLGNITGVISIEPEPKGCFQDPSGLYIGILIKNPENCYTTLVLYEIGTGRKAGELSKLDNCDSLNSIKWNFDGRFIVIGGSSGILSLWRTPDQIINKITEMNDHLRRDKEFWTHFPLELNNKSLRNGTNPLVFDATAELNDTQGAFYNSIVKLKKQPQRNLVRNEQLYVVTDAPVTLTRRSRSSNPVKKTVNNDPNLYYSSAKTNTQFRPRGITSVDSFTIESVNQTVMEDPRDIDIECEQIGVNNDFESFSNGTNNTEEREQLYGGIDRFL